MAIRDEHLKPAQLSALADGTLDPARRDDVEARVSASPALTDLVERERRVVALLHHVRAHDRAPEQLRARVEALRPREPAARAPRRPASRLALAVPAVAALAAVAVVLALVLPAGTPGGPSVSEAAALALRGPLGPPPAPDPAHRYLLHARVGQLAFPSWHDHGLRVTGVRRDRLDGHQVVTVYYAGRGGRLAYAIVSSPALRRPPSAGRWVGGLHFQTLLIGGRTVITWRQAGHTCVLAARGATAAAMERLVAERG